MNGSAPRTAPAAPATDRPDRAGGTTDVDYLKSLHRRRPFGAWFKDKGWRHLVGIVVTIFAVFPLLYVLSAALNSTGTLVGSNALFSKIDFGNFTALFNMPSRPFARWFLNTMVVGGVTSAATVFLGAMAAYAFSRMRFTGRRVGPAEPAPAADVPAAARRRRHLPAAQRHLRGHSRRWAWAASWA